MYKNPIKILEFLRNQTQTRVLVQPTDISMRGTIPSCLAGHVLHVHVSLFTYVSLSSVEGWIKVIASERIYWSTVCNVLAVPYLFPHVCSCR